MGSQRVPLLGPGMVETSLKPELSSSKTLMTLVDVVVAMKRMFPEGVTPVPQKGTLS